VTSPQTVGDVVDVKVQTRLRLIPRARPARAAAAIIAPNVHFQPYHLHQLTTSFRIRPSKLYKLGSSSSAAKQQLEEDSTDAEALRMIQYVTP